MAVKKKTTSAPKIGFVGFGNMAQAMAKGWKSAAAGVELFASSRRAEVLKTAAEALGVTPVASNRALAEAVDVVVVAVKPYLVAEVIAEMGEALKGKLVISVAVNVTNAMLSEMLQKATGEKKTAHSAILPNTPVAVNAGVLLAEEGSLNATEKKRATALLSSLGRVVFLAQEKIGVAGVISGCGPAFTALFIEALGDAAVKWGLPRATAYELTSQMILGTGALQLATGAHPGVMKDAVCSPGGTTIQGVSALERKGFRRAAIAAVDAVMKK